MNKMTKKQILSHALTALVAVIVTAAVMLGIFLYRERSNKLTMLQKVIDQYFIGEVDQTAMEDAAAHAMVGALGDRWSYYIPADEYAAYTEQMNNAYVGVGITVTVEEDGSLLVNDVAKNSPALEAGIQIGDVVTKVDGQSILGMNTAESGKLIAGEENTTVNLTVLRDGEELTITVTRRTIEVVVAEGQMLEGDIGLVTIANFNEKCASETIAAIESLQAQGAKKIIFDVRNNPGGYASELVDILDYLLPEGKLFTTVDYSGKEETEMSDARCLDIPMAVLINGNSYSAAEFFAAAMAEYDAAVIVGEKTCGKGYFQTAIQLPDGSAVGLSIGKYYTPQGKSLADVGVTPDVPVEPAENQAGLKPLEDPQILAAMEALDGK